MERDLYPCPITPQTRHLLTFVILLNLYKEATSLKGNTTFLTQLIAYWDHDKQAFQVSPDQLFRPLRRTYILSKGYLGEVRNFLSYMMSQLELQNRINQYMFKDMLIPTSLTLLNFRSVVGNSSLFLLVERMLGVSLCW